MKRLLIVAMLVVACLGLLAAPALASAATFYVHPSGGNDTANIQAAFNAAVKAGPGSTVQLSAGHFYANNIVVAGFNGTFKGAGQDQTFIDTLRGLNEKLPGLGLPVDPAAPKTFLAPYPVFFAFDGGTVRVSDLTFDITAPDPAKKLRYYGAMQNDVDTVVLVTGSASSAFARVGFIAHPSLPGYTSDGWPYNVNQCIWIAVGGVDTVSACTFQNAAHGVVEADFDGTLTVGGSPGAANRFVNEGQNAFTIAGAGGTSTVFSYNVVDDTAVPEGNSAQCGVVSFQPDNSSGFVPWLRRVVIAHNTMTGCWEGVVAWQTDDGSGGPLWPVHMLIADNSITTTHSDDEGMYLEDDFLAAGGGTSLDADISGNHIVLNDTIRGGIDAYSVNDAQASDNRISGSGYAGIYLGYSGDTDSAWQIIGNDVSHLTASVAPIWLGLGTTDCTVIGGPPPTTVLDEGTDNILVNVTQIADPPAQAAAMTPLRQMGLPQQIAVR